MAALLTPVPPRLTAAQRRHGGAFLRFCPQAHPLRQLVFPFRALLGWREAGQWARWIERDMGSGFHGVTQLARTLRRDLKAEELAIETALAQ